MLRDPDKQVMEKAYARWAPVYDALCGPVFLNGRRAAARAAREAGGRLQQQGGFADSGIAANQNRRGRHEAAAQHSI